MRSLGQHVFVMACTVATITASSFAQDNGRISQRLALGSVDYQFRQVASVVAGSNDNQLRLWPMSSDWLADAPVAQLTMPFDIPTAVLQLAPGDYVLAGRQRTSGLGVLCRVSVGASSPMLTLVSASLQPLNQGYSQLFYNSIDQYLYGMAYEDDSVFAAPWNLNTAIPSLQVTTAIGPISGAEIPGGVHRFRKPVSSGSPAPGAFLVSSSQDIRDRSQPKVLWLRLVSGAWLLSAVTGTINTPLTCGVSYPVYQSLTEPVLAVAPAGPSELLRVSTNTVIGTVQIANAWQPTPYTLSQALQVGEMYRSQSGTIRGADFWPTYRAGYNTSAQGHQIGLGELQQSEFRVGNADFALWTRVLHSPGVTSLPGNTASFMWAKIGAPGPSTVATLPTGEVIILNPDATFGPSPFDDEMSGEQNLLHVPLSLQGADILNGFDIIFQFLHVLPNGELIISDVFGGRVLPAATLAAAAPLAHSPANTQACRQWLRQRGCPLWQSILIRAHALMSLMGDLPFLPLWWL